MSNPTTVKPIESLGFLANVLQRMSLPHISDNGQLSHTLIAKHVENVERALLNPTASPQPDKVASE